MSIKAVLYRQLFSFIVYKQQIDLSLVSYNIENWFFVE